MRFHAAPLAGRLRFSQERMSWQIRRFITPSTRQRIHRPSFDHRHKIGIWDFTDVLCYIKTAFFCYLQTCMCCKISWFDPIAEQVAFRYYHMPSCYRKETCTLHLWVMRVICQDRCSCSVHHRYAVQEIPQQWTQQLAWKLRATCL